MIQDLTRKDIIHLLCGCEPGMEYVNMLQQHGLGVYAGGMNNHWKWTDKYSDHWNDVSDEELWQLYLTVTNDDRNEYAPPQVYVVADEYDADIRAAFPDEETAERYIDAKNIRGMEVYPIDFNPRFKEAEHVWCASLLPETMELELQQERDGEREHMVGYLQHNGDWLDTWLIATNRHDARAKANEMFLTVIQGREQGKFRYINQKIYIPDRTIPELKHYPFYDVASGKMVMGEFGAVLLPKEEALLPDGTPNTDPFILLNRHYVEYVK